jgi:hypothetical protein
MASLENREPARRERAGSADRPEGWRELLPDLLWPLILVVAVLMVIGLAL